MKARDQLRELKDLSVEGLKTKELEFSEELFWLKIKHRSGQLSNYSNIKKIRKNLARVQTLLHSKEKLGVHTDKGASDEEKRD